MHIRFEIGDSRYGQLLLACTRRGIAALFLATTREALIAELKQAFAQAEIQECKGMAEFEQVKAYLNNPCQPFTLLLDMQGTTFQQQIWQALLSIPLGQTLSYSQLAEKLNKPKAFRAVANACGANKIAFLIPCHRVIGSNGAITGYRWGVERKREMLKYEQYCLQNEQ